MDGRDRAGLHDDSLNSKAMDLQKAACIDRIDLSLSSPKLH